MSDNSKRQGRVSVGLIALAAVLALALARPPGGSQRARRRSEVRWAAWHPADNPTPPLFPPLL